MPEEFMCSIEKCLPKIIVILTAYFLGYTEGLFAASSNIGQAEWDKLVEAAKSEGQLTIHSGAILALIIDEGVFQKKFPEIKIVRILSTGGAEATQRIMAERRAQKYAADLIIAAPSSIWPLYLAKALDPIPPALVFPEVSDESKWWQGKHRYVDPDEKYIFTFMGSPRGPSVYYNTKIVKPSEFTSFWDFLNPKWKGKIEVRDLRDSGAAPTSMRFLYYHPDLGPNFIRRLFSEMDVTLFRDRRQPVDRLATGKYAICFLCLPTEITKARNDGLPIGEFGTLKEGSWLDSLTSNIGLLNKAPNRSAATVFLNWLLSREGQVIAQRVNARANVGVSNSLRTDIPKDMVPTDERPVEGAKYLEIDSPERISPRPLLKVLNEALAEADKKAQRKQ
jgi:ABC-type Fe3+ transport system substrate-binding protein